MSISYWQDDSSQNSRQFDIAVIGGGIAGFSTAYWLKQEDPSLKVAVIERHSIGAGATGRNAGFITCGSVEHFNRLVERWGAETAGEMWRYSETNLSMLIDRIIQDDPNLEFEHRGTFSLASTTEELAELREASRLMKQLDISVEELNEKDLRERLDVHEFVGGIKYLKDAAVHPLKLLRKIAQKSGAVVIENNEVHSMTSTAEGTVELQTNRAKIEASVAVMALNGYSSTLHPYFTDKIYPTRGQIMVTEPVEKFMEGPCYANFVLDYFRQLNDGRIIIGGFRQLEKATEVGYSDHTTDVIQNALYQFLQKHLPRLKDKRVTHRWAGVMGFSSDGQVMIGSLPDQPQVYFVGGFTAHGLGLAFHSGKCLTDLLYGRPIPDFISAKRF